MTPERLAEIRARLDAATPGPWYTPKRSMSVMTTDVGYVVASDCRFIDAEFIAHAPTDIADLIAEVELLQTYITTNAVLRQRIRELEARNDDPRWKELAGELVTAVLSIHSTWTCNPYRRCGICQLRARYDSMMKDQEGNLT